MGINSTEVSYGFGQMGSAIATIADKLIFPPKDHVIIAITFMSDTVIGTLTSEILDTQGPQYISTNDTEATASNYLGVTEAAAASVSGNVVTIADVASNVKIKPGQYVIIGADGDTIDNGITLDAGAGHLTPIYNGPNAQGVVVVSLTGGTYGTTLTLGAPTGSGVAVDVSSIDSSNTLYFLDEYHGVGGTTAESVRMRAGATIYGRWTAASGSTITDGDRAGMVCYFGK